MELLLDFCIRPVSLLSHVSLSQSYRQSYQYAFYQCFMVMHLLVNSLDLPLAAAVDAAVDSHVFFLPSFFSPSLIAQATLTIPIACTSMARDVIITNSTFN